MNKFQATTHRSRKGRRTQRRGGLKNSPLTYPDTISRKIPTYELLSEEELVKLERNIEFGGDSKILAPAYGSPFVTDLKGI